MAAPGCPCALLMIGRLMTRNSSAMWDSWRVGRDECPTRPEASADRCSTRRCADCGVDGSQMRRCPPRHRAEPESEPERQRAPPRARVRRLPASERVRARRRSDGLSSARGSGTLPRRRGAVARAVARLVRSGSSIGSAAATRREEDMARTPARTRPTRPGRPPSRIRHAFASQLRRLAGAASTPCRATERSNSRSANARRGNVGMSSWPAKANSPPPAPPRRPVPAAASESAAPGWATRAADRSGGNRPRRTSSSPRRSTADSRRDSRSLVVLLVDIVVAVQLRRLGFQLGRES